MTVSSDHYMIHASCISQHIKWDSHLNSEQTLKILSEYSYSSFQNSEFSLLMIETEEYDNETDFVSDIQLFKKFSDIYQTVFENSLIKFCILNEKLWSSELNHSVQFE